MVPPPDKQYGVSKEEQQRILLRAQMRDALKLEFRKQVTSPHVRSAGEGYIFDPAVQRYISMKATLLDTFKPTLKSFAVYLGMCVIPICSLTYYFYTSRKGLEQKYRNGEIAYKDRLFKFK